MSYIIGNKCVSVCDTACAKVCPVDCINGPIIIDGLGREVELMDEDEKRDKQLYINPDICIDCGACVPECPVDAIYPTEEDAIREGDLISVNKNYEFYGQTFKQR
jgi:formate hydrogenlyase subunit 6/NADH:ubiquinone oxidoreductase subunit I